jgi:hypothetical protein
MKKIFYATAVIFSLLLTSSCKKDPVEQPADPTEKKYELDYKANALLQVEIVANEMEYIGRNVARNSVSYPNGGTFLGVASITRTASDVGEDITLDFGAGAMCTDGNTRSGKLVIEYNEWNDDTMLRPVNYKVNNFNITGDYSIGYVSTPTASFENFVVPSGAIVKDGQNKIEFNLSRKTRQVEGITTVNETDDVFDRSDLSYFLTATVSGKATILRVKGVTATTVAKLKNSCSNTYFPVTGQVKVEYAASGASTDPNNPQTGDFYLTFGNGNCGDKPFTQKSL